MGQAELRSSGLLSPKSGPLVKGVANSNIKTEANQPLPARNERSDRIEAVLGYQYGSEVVHRNNLVLL